MKNPNKSNQNGIALILSIMMVSLLLVLGMYFLSNSLTENLIAGSQAAGVEAYYLAEAGINEMLWKITNDPLYEEGFMHGDDWSTTTVRVDPFGAGTGVYTIVASNTSSAHCDIYSTGQVDIGNGNFAQRIIKTDIFRAIGTSSVDDSAGYADGNITITNSYVKFLGGSAHSNNTFIVNNSAVQMFVDSDLRATNNYNEHNMASTTILGWVYADNWSSYANGTGTADAIVMPAVDFNSAAATSYENQAIALGGYYTEADFDALICANMNGSLTLTKKVTYVDGDVDLLGPIELRYPPTGGVLVVNDDFIVGSGEYKQCGPGPSNRKYGRPDITFVHVAGKPSGILAGKKMRFLEYTGDIDIEGVLYSDAEMDIANLDPSDSSFYVKGGAISWKLDISSCFGWITIEHDNQTLIDTIGGVNSSPTIIVEHWEEEY